MRPLVLALILCCAAPAGAETLILANLEAAPAMTAKNQPLALTSRPVAIGIGFVGAVFLVASSLMAADEVNYGFGCESLTCNGPFLDLPPHYGAVHH